MSYNLGFPLGEWVLECSPFSGIFYLATLDDKSFINDQQSDKVKPEW